MPFAKRPTLRATERTRRCTRCVLQSITVDPRPQPPTAAYQVRSPQGQGRSSAALYQSGVIVAPQYITSIDKVKASRCRWLRPGKSPNGMLLSPHHSPPLAPNLRFCSCYQPLPRPRAPCVPGSSPHAPAHACQNMARVNWPEATCLRCPISPKRCLAGPPCPTSLPPAGCTRTKRYGKPPHPITSAMHAGAGLSKHEATHWLNHTGRGRAAGRVTAQLSADTMCAATQMQRAPANRSTT